MIFPIFLDADAVEVDLLDAEVEGGRVLGQDVDVGVGVLEERVLPEGAGVVPARLMQEVDSVGQFTSQSRFQFIYCATPNTMS